MPRTISALLLLLAFAVPALAAGPLPKPAANVKCQVCGMFVAKYPDFLARIAFRDGAVAWFDGPKDLFRFYNNMAAYDRRHQKKDVAEVTVTNYYSLAAIDGKKALYVLGTDVFGPMGKELVPCSSRAEANDLMKDHKGTRILRFTEVTPALLKGLE
ncbi:nitrous oxide reductase accessory protein NosL [Geomesophilobacter sediminis]|uniref:Nitrous oxide reductase accessory protein NosL n=1 Tax=Geomesophilobacter sediminis TaxID=2798584 RepID=A0A8J7J501_9BACT|nr:nitrous oxide reductase accessory protein NosL [Geomesophilobacter sediminis]MBJ6723356.1 nitrous oxide reductase accessory protein NosL [Geomesophilobacter sediminis]